MKIMLSVGSTEPTCFKDIFKCATQELQAINDRRTARLFPPVDVPEPDKAPWSLLANEIDQAHTEYLQRQALKTTQENPKPRVKGIAEDAFRAIVENEMRRRGRTPRGPKTEES